MTLQRRGREGSLDSRCSCPHGSGSQLWVMHVKRGELAVTLGHVLNLHYTARPHFSFPLWDGTCSKQGSRRNFFQFACYTEEQNSLSVSS